MALRAVGLWAGPGRPRHGPARPAQQLYELLACSSGPGTAHRAMGRQKADPRPARKNFGPGRVWPGSCLGQAVSELPRVVSVQVVGRAQPN